MRLRLTWAILVCALAACDPETITTEVGEFDIGTGFSGRSIQSFYLTMRDGVRLAVDLHLPQPLPNGVEVPTIIIMTRYWRADQDGEKSYLGWRLEEAARRGYATVVVDERGTGASFGRWRYAWMPESQEDYAEVVDWIVSQDWSNDRVGAWGASYFGATAQLLPTTLHPAVKVAVPTFTQYDLFADIVFPGGVFNEWFMYVWNEGLRAMDSSLAVKRVDDDADGTLLAAAVAEHTDNGNIYEGSRTLTYRDEVSTVLGISIDDISAHTRFDALEQSNAVLYHWGSWMDHGTAQGVITRFLTLDNPQQAAIGAWVHGGFDHASPYSHPSVEAQPSEGQQWRETLNFLDDYLKTDSSTTTEKLLYYYTMGAEEWRSTSVWPVEGMTTERWYFSANNTLSTSLPAVPEARDIYEVDFTTTSGTQTRWHTAQDGVPVVYPDRRVEDQKLLTYTSEPLSEDTEITGHPVVTLYTTSTHTDGAYFVYLEDIDSLGRVTYVTEGQLRALHRRVSDDSAPYELLVPYHSFKEHDAEFLVPGEITEITFGLHPTSVVIRAGHRIRVAIAGHDANVFERIPESGDPSITIERNTVHASMIELPVVRR